MLRKFAAILLAGTMLAGVPRPARAEPITLSILTAIGVTGLSATAVSAITIAGTLALSVGASLLQSALTEKPAPPASGSTLQTQYGGAVPRQAIIGTQATNGHLIYANVYGPENKILQAVYVLGDGEHDSLTDLWVNGNQVGLDDAVPLGDYGQAYVVHDLDTAGSINFYVAFYRGTWDQPADQGLVDNANPAGRWTTDHRGRGVCYAIITQFYNEEKGLTGIPDVRFEVKGLRQYDARLDDTNGGTGPHRWGDTSTYAWSDNPAVAEYNYRRGIFINDQCILGMEVLPADLILPMYVAAANDCDEDVALKEGGTEKRYRVSMTASADRQHSDVLDVLRNAMAGYTLERAGQFGPIAGVAQIADVDLTITDLDWEVGEQRQHSKWRTRSEVATAVHGRFSDPAQKWEAVSFPARENATRDTAAGERLSLEIDLTQVPSSSQAQRIAEIHARRSMLGNGSGVLPARFIPLQPGDWVPFTSARHGSQTVMITGVTVRPDHKVAVTYDVTATNVYSWTPAGDELDPPDYGVPGQPGTLTTTVADFAVEGAQQTGASGLTIPGIRATWTPITDPSVDRVIILYRRPGSTDVMEFKAEYPSAGLAFISEGIQAATLYECSADLQTTPQRTTTPTDWFSVTSGSDHIVPHALTADTGVDVATLKLVRDIEERPLIELGKVEQFIAAYGAEEAAAAMLQGMEAKRKRWLEKVARRQGDVDAVAEANAFAEATADSAIASYHIVAQATFATPANVATAKSEAIASSETYADSAIAAYAIVAQATFATPASVATAKSEAVALSETYADSAIAAYSVTAEATFATPANVATAKSEAIAAAASDTDSAIAAYAVTAEATFATPTNVATAKTEAISTASVNTDAAIATYDASVSTSYGGLSASVTESVNAIATIDGKVAGTWTVTLDVNGRISALKAYNDGSTSGFIFITDNFQVLKPDLTAMFTVANVNGVPTTVVNGTFYADEIIDLRKLGTGAAHAEAYIAVAGTPPSIQTGNSSTWADVCTLTLTTDGGEASIEFQTDFQGSNSGAAPFPPSFRTLVDGVQVGVIWTQNWSAAYGNLTSFHIALQYVHLHSRATGLSNGSHTFKVQGKAGTGGISGGGLRVTNLRKRATS